MWLPSAFITFWRYWTIATGASAARAGAAMSIRAEARRTRAIASATLDAAHRLGRRLAHGVVAALRGLLERGECGARRGAQRAERARRGLAHVRQLVVERRGERGDRDPRRRP